MNAMIDIL